MNEMTRRASANGPLISATLSDVLSEHALRCLDQLDVRRDLTQTVSVEVLRRAMIDKGLPVSDHVLDFESRCGGSCWPFEGFACLDRLGAWVGIAARESQGRVLPADLSIEMAGEILVPISAEGGLCSLWMGPQGTVFLCDDIDEAPQADSYRIMLEREALKWGDRDGFTAALCWSGMPTMTDEDFVRFEKIKEEEDAPDDAPHPTYSDDLDEVFDRRLANAVGLPLFGPATDRWRSVWFDGDRLLFPRYPWRESERLLRTKGMNELVELVRAAVAIRPEAVVTWGGSRGDAPRPGEPVVASVPTRAERYGDICADLLFIGTPGNYRVHERPRANPISTARWWQQRREAWRAERAGTKQNG